jgi:hypothetical protein
MVTLPIRYPLDGTGVNPDNKIVGEIHTLPNRTVRAIALGYGAFFAESIVVRDVATGHALTKNVQYSCTEMLEFPTGRYGKEIDTIVLIKDSTVSSQVEVDYQVLGGSYSTNVDAIIQMLNSADLDNRPVAWGDIIGKPDAFTPAFHYHDIGDLYGFEYVVHAIERVREAILVGDDASHDQIYRYIDASFAQLDTHITTVETNLNSHIANQNNPHATTKSQVGLGNVDNFATATNLQAQAGTASNLFMTPASTAAAINAQAGAALQAHLADHNNPHVTTASQVGLGNVQNFGIATVPQAQAGTDTQTYMTPYLTAQAIQSQVGNALNALTNTVNAHIADHNNPHATNAFQVGLGLVQNYGVATTTDAQAGTATNLYMTPALVKTAITAFASPVWYVGAIANPGADANTIGGSHSGLTYANNAPYTGPLVRFDAGGYDLELNANYSGGASMAFRTRNGDTSAWNAWHTLADSDGVNATGTWGISISGNAATATTAVKASSMIRVDNTSLTWNYSHTAGTFSSQPAWLLMTNDGQTMAPYAPASLSVGFATNATQAVNANHVTLVSANTNQAFNWAGQSGQPTWLWGANDPNNAYVYNPSNFHVALADVANSAPGYLPLTGGTLQGPGNLQVNGTTTTAAINASAAVTVTGEWFRSVGDNGWYSNTYGGGIFMQDTSWVRVYNNKGLLTGGQVQAGSLQINGTGVFTGAVSGSDFTETSDARIKTNLVQVANARRRLLDTTIGYQYDKDGVPTFGLLAQDLEKEFGLLVKTGSRIHTDGDLLKEVSYNGLWAPAIETLRDMDEQLAVHEEKLAEQDAIIKDQAERLKSQGQVIADLLIRMANLEKKSA